MTCLLVRKRSHNLYFDYKDTYFDYIDTVKQLCIVCFLANLNQHHLCKYYVQLIYEPSFAHCDRVEGQLSTRVKWTLGTVSSIQIIPISSLLTMVYSTSMEGRSSSEPNWRKPSQRNTLKMVRIKPVANCTIE